MRRARPTCLGLTLGLSSLALALGLFPSLAAAVGLDLWNVPAALNAMGEAADLDGRLDEALQAVQLRRALKDEVTEDVVAGRLTLVEAAAQFRRLDADASEGYRQGWRLLAAMTDAARAGRFVEHGSLLAMDGYHVRVRGCRGSARAIWHLPGAFALVCPVWENRL